MADENENLEFHNDLLSDMPEPPAPSDPVENMEPDIAAPGEEQTRSPRTRSADGKFQSASPDEETPELDHDEPEQDDDTDYIEPPARMPVEDQQLFHKLPREGRELINRLAHEKETKFQRTAQELNGIKTRYAPLEKILAPRRAQFQRDGSNEAQVVDTLLKLSDWASREPMEFIKYVAQENKIDLGSLGFGASQAPAWVDPELQKRDARIAQLEQQIQGIGGTVNQWNSQAQQSQTRQVHGQIQSFRDATGTDGQPLHPYFDEVEADMTFLMSQDRASTLDDAYDMAVNLNPSTRERLRTQEKARDDRRRNEEAKKHADKAKRAGSSLSGSSNGVTRRPTKGGSVAQRMSEIWDRQMGESL